jgi:hypothetical protein
MILFGNFWSFLLTLSGIIDFVIGVLVITDVIHVTEHSLMAAIICFGVGFAYLMGGITIAIVKMRKGKKKTAMPASNDKAQQS